MIEYVKKNKRTLFLKVSLVFMFIPVALVTVLSSPSLYFEAVESTEVNVYFVLSFVILVDLVLIPIAVAIYQTIKLFSNIEKDNYYSEQSINSFNVIKICGLIVSGLFIAMYPSIFYFAEIDDAPGLALIGLVFVAACMFVAVFAVVVRDVVKKGMMK